MRLFTAVVCLVVLLAGCSDDNDSSDPVGSSAPQEGGGWLEQWAGSGFTEATYEGDPVLVDEEERVLYIEDCDAAREATGSGGPYGPSGGEAGYAYVCE